MAKVSFAEDDDVHSAMAIAVLAHARRKLVSSARPPSQTFVEGIVVVCREMIRERITELQSSGSGQS